jgi:signal recognition particle subunit SRP19
VYPRYFDAKVSVADGRRVPRKSALWWPQATHIAQACASLGLPSVLEPEKTHPADWENPGRVKVQLERDGRPINPIVKNRESRALIAIAGYVQLTPGTQLYAQLARQMQNANPKLVPAEADMKPRNGPKPKDEGKKKKGKGPAVKAPAPFATRPPAAPSPLPRMDERLPVHSPTAATGVAVSSIKRDLEAEKEAKKKGLGPPEEGAKAPKMKRIMVRGKR